MKRIMKHVILISVDIFSLHFIIMKMEKKFSNIHDEFISEWFSSKILNSIRIWNILSNMMFSYHIRHGRKMEDSAGAHIIIIIIIFSSSNSGLNNPSTYSIHITISAYPTFLLLLNLLINWCERNWRNVSILKGSWWGGGDKVTYWGLLS